MLSDDGVGADKVASLDFLGVGQPYFLPEVCAGRLAAEGDDDGVVEDDFADDVGFPDEQLQDDGGAGGGGEQVNWLGGLGVR